MAGLKRCLRHLSIAVLLACTLAAGACTNQDSESAATAPEQKMYTAPHPVPFPSGMTGSHATQP